MSQGLQKQESQVSQQSLISNGEQMDGCSLFQNVSHFCMLRTVFKNIVVDSQPINQFFLSSQSAVPEYKKGFIISCQKQQHVEYDYDNVKLYLDNFDTCPHDEDTPIRSISVFGGNNHLTSALKQPNLSQDSCFICGMDAKSLIQSGMKKNIPKFKQKYQFLCKNCTSLLSFTQQNTQNKKTGIEKNIGQKKVCVCGETFIGKSMIDNKIKHQAQCQQHLKKQNKKIHK